MDAGETNDETASDSQQSSPRSNTGSVEAFKTHIVQNKVTFALFCARVLQIMFAFGYLLPIFSSSESAYNKSLVASLATSALRLHQRVPQLQLSRQCLTGLLLEDACHYLIFSIMFLYSGHPLSLALMPLTLFSVLHGASYALRLLDLLGQNNWWGARFLISIVEVQSQNILRAIAMTEIFIMPYAIIMLFSGRSSLLIPFMHYRFLTLRYSSRRNPYCRTIFHELRLLTEQLAGHPSCPAMAANMLRRAITMVSSMCPQHAAQ